MPSPTLDQDRADQSVPAQVPPRRRRTAVLVVSTFLVLGIGTGAAVALAGRPARTAGTAAPPASIAAPPASTTAPPASAPATPVAKPPTTTAQPAGQAVVTQPPVLPNGRHHAYIRRVDLRHDQIVVDVVQVFQDDAAVKAAIEDGKPRDYAQYLTVYVRNQSGRLRTLPLADDLKVDLIVPCGDEATPRAEVLGKLAENAATRSYYYTLTVKDGVVLGIAEHLAVNAC